MNKVICKKKVGNSVFGKIMRNDKVRWVFQFIRDNSVMETSYRKSCFKDITKFESFLKNKKWI